MNITGVIALVDNFNFLASGAMKVDLGFMENVRTGRGMKNFMDMAAEEDFNFRNFYFKDEFGQVRYKVVTGKVLDYKA
jgi:hypothetical protein